MRQLKNLNSPQYSKIETKDSNTITKSNSTINLPKVFIFASSLEAKPIIDKYNFKNVLQNKNITAYYYESNNLYIIISGVGFINASVAITSFYKTFVELINNSLLFNIGFAGSYYLPKYGIYLASQVINFHNKDSFFPSIIIQSNDCQFTNLYSIMHSANSEIMRNYKNSLFDMEAYAIAKSAQYFLQNHYIHFIKFVSDNSGHFENKTEIIENYKVKFDNILDITDKIYYIVHQNFADDYLISINLQKYIEEIECYISLTKSQKIILKKALAYIYNKNTHNDKINLIYNYLKQYSQPLVKSQRNQIFHKIINFLYDNEKYNIHREQNY